MKTNKRITRGKSIKEFCKICMGCDEWYGGTVGTKINEASIMVKNCESVNCPLWPFRVGKEADGTNQRIKLPDKHNRGIKKVSKTRQNSKRIVEAKP